MQGFDVFGRSVDLLDCWTGTVLDEVLQWFVKKVFDNFVAGKKAKEWNR